MDCVTVWARELAAAGSLEYAELPRSAFSDDESDDEDEEGQEEGGKTGERRERPSPEPLFLPSSPTGSEDDQLDKDVEMDTRSVPEKPKGRPRPVPKPRAPLLETDELEEDFPAPKSKPKAVRKTVLSLKTAGTSTGTRTREEAPQPEAGTSGKRPRQSGEMTEPKRVKIAEKEKGKEKEKAPSRSLREYVEVDITPAQEETHPDLLREPLEEKIAAFQRRNEKTDLKGVLVSELSRVRLSEVPGLLDKVRVEFLLLGVLAY